MMSMTRRQFLIQSEYSMDLQTLVISLQRRIVTCKPLADKLNETATQLGYNSCDEVNFVLAFVQSIPYKLDNASTAYQDYPRFPVETLVDDVGDCKSHSVLFATLMLILDYGTVFINPPDHLAVGILGNNLPGTYVTCNNKLTILRNYRGRVYTWRASPAIQRSNR